MRNFLFDSFWFQSTAFRIFFSSVKIERKILLSDSGSLTLYNKWKDLRRFVRHVRFYCNDSTRFYTVFHSAFTWIETNFYYSFLASISSCIYVMCTITMQYHVYYIPDIFFLWNTCVILSTFTWEHSFTMVPVNICYRQRTATK